MFNYFCIAGDDYVSRVGMVGNELVLDQTFVPGVVRNITIDIIDDNVVEERETFLLVIADVGISQISTSPSMVNVTVEDDDGISYNYLCSTSWETISFEGQ